MSEIIQHTDTSIKDLQRVFGKSQAAVGMAVKRMLERNPDHPEWKYKKDKTIMIAAAGVEWLANEYFITNYEVSTVDPEKIKLEEENKHLHLLLEKMGEQYRERLNLELKLQEANIRANNLILEYESNHLKEENQALKDKEEELKKKAAEQEQHIKELEDRLEKANKAGLLKKIFTPKW